MTTPQVKTRITSVRRSTNSVRRAAFTLVELMVVILIIGILAGIAAPVIFRALRVSKEFTITNEVQQMNAAVEKFKTDHGFYPPAFRIQINNANDFRRYLNRIAPNHAESSSGGLTKWWSEVGSKLDERSGLVFWLSGLCTSKQYPLSGNAEIAGATDAEAVLAPYNANKLVNDDDTVAYTTRTIDRNVFFEFQRDQLVIADPSNADIAGIKAYHQPEGSGADLAYRYRDFKSYSGGSNIAYHLEDPSTSEITYFNPTTFQIVGPGMDGVLFELPDTNLVDSNDPTQDDNITNFSNGRLEKSFE